MLLKLLKSNRIVNFSLVLLAGAIFWLRNLIQPVKYPYYPGEAENLLYHFAGSLFNNSLFLQNLLGLLVVIFIAFIIQQINNHYNIIPYRTLLPAFIFFIITAGFIDLHTIHPVHFASIFILLAINRLFGAFNKSKPYSVAFDTGFLIAVAALFYFTSFILLPAFLIGMVILARDNQWRNYVLLLVGFILPFLFAFSYTIITDQFLELLKIFEYNVLTINNKLGSNIYLQLYLGLLVVMISLGSIKIISTYDIKKVSTRKYFTVLFLIFVSSLSGIIIIPASSQEMLVIAAIPLTFLLSEYFYSIKSRIRGELIFMSLTGAVIILNIIS